MKMLYEAFCGFRECCLGSIMFDGAEDNKAGYDRICEYNWTSERLFFKVCVIWLMSKFSGRHRNLYVLYMVFYFLF